MHTTHTVCGCGKSFVIETEEAPLNIVIRKTEDVEECEGCKEAKEKGGDFHCEKHWVMPSSGFLDEDGKDIEKEYTSRENDGFAQCEKKIEFPAIVFKGTGFTQSAESKKSDNQ